MIGTKAWKIAALPILLAAASALAKDGKWDLFLLFGQSNMAGPPAGEAGDKVTNPRIKVLAYDNCSGLGRTYNQWYLASPPLHECFNGVGPADWFSKTLIDTGDKLGLGIDTIGLIPCSISGAPINLFRKGATAPNRSDFRIPPDNSLPSAYPWMVARIREAMKKGTVRGILFHQGESNPGDPAWPGYVKGILDSLKKEFDWGDLPFLAGELRYDNQGAGNTVPHNAQVAKLPGLIRNCSVVSAKGLPGLNDPWHFNLVAMREFGHRYCAAMVPYLKEATSAFRGRAGPGIPGLRVEAANGGRSLHANLTLDRLTLVSLRGETSELGSGREFPIPSRRLHAGIHILRAETGSSVDVRMLNLDPQTP